MAMALPIRSIEEPRIAHGTLKAEEAVLEALTFLRKRLGWSGSKVASILHLPANTVNDWFAKKRVPVGHPPFTPTVQSVLQLIAIHRSLHAMFAEPANQLAWLNSPHPDFGVAPIEMMKESVEGLILVRQYLDYSRGRGA